MLESSLNRILAEIPQTATVLDIGGWAKPLTRADWVIDLMPYESRAPYGRDGAGEERFAADRWIQRDLCSREPYPFDDDSLDFVVCSHTLEDVRDPLWVCSEMVRVGKAGYVEVPSRLEEQSWGVQGPWVGWGHHHWLVDVGPNELRFVFKPHVLHGHEDTHFPSLFGEALTAEQRVSTLWWEGGFGFSEQVFIGPGQVERYLSDFVAAHLPPVEPPRPKRLRSRLRGS
jgi:Methyltransferase domain